MKKFFISLLAALPLLLCACGQEGPAPFVNPGDTLNGGGTVLNIPSATVSDRAARAAQVVGELSEGGVVPATAVPATETITSAGDYVVRDAWSGKLTVSAENVHLYLENASMESAKKVIESAFDLTVTLIGENSVKNTDASGANAIACDGTLVINGAGSLSVTATKNGISANSVAVKDAALTVNAEKDGLHAEIDYDNATSAPAFSYEAGGYVVLDGAKLTAFAQDDGIQADTFVLIRGESDVHIKTNGGAPQTITEQSSDLADGKGIKAGAIDWGTENTEIVSDDYLIAVEGGTVEVDANDDAFHSDGELVISSGALTIAAGDDAMHAERLLTFAGGRATVSRCYEGLEAAKVEISGGEVSVTAADDGINASDGSANKETNNPNCHILISGGTVEVNAEGDGIDSNGAMLISGGTVYVTGPQNGANAALDSNGGILVNGGYLFAVGPIGMVETPASNSTQNIVSFAQSSAIAAGTNLTLTDENGSAIFTYTATKRCQSVIVSCPELETGKSYAIYGGDTSLCTFTVSARITTVGSAGGMGDPWGMPNGGGNPMRPGGRH